MPWLQLRIDTQREHCAALEDALMAAGAVSVTMQDRADQPILEPALGETPLWDNIRLTGLFDAGIDTDQAILLATANFGDTLPNYRWELLEDKDWEREWMDNFHPMRFGQRLWICPSWQPAPDHSAVNVMLDPGLAFGTGTHPTTSLCLQWLDSIDLNGKTVIDYGCGSGVLGIAAKLLGACNVVAIDNDPQALIATRENAGRNNINSESLQTLLPDDMPGNYQADIIIANILAGPLVELAATIAARVKPEGRLALSGILDSQAQTLSRHYAPFFNVMDPIRQQDWVLLSAIKR